MHCLAVLFFFSRRLVAVGAAQVFAAVICFCHHHFYYYIIMNGLRILLYCNMVTMCVPISYCECREVNKIRRFYYKTHDNTVDYGNVYMPPCNRSVSHTQYILFLYHSSAIHTYTLPTNSDNLFFCRSLLFFIIQAT